MKDSKQRTRAISVGQRTTTPTQTTPTTQIENSNSAGIVKKRHSTFSLPNNAHVSLLSSSGTNSLDLLVPREDTQTPTAHTTHFPAVDSSSRVRPDRPPRNPARSSTLGLEGMSSNGNPVPMSAAASSSSYIPASPSPSYQQLKAKSRPTTATGAVPTTTGWNKADITPWDYQQFAPASAGVMGFGGGSGGGEEKGDSRASLEGDDVEGRDGVDDLPSMNGFTHTKGGHNPRGTEGSSQSTSGGHSGHGKAQYAASSSSGKQQAPSVRSRASSHGMAHPTSTGPVEDVTPWELFPGPSAEVNLPSPSASVSGLGSVGSMNASTNGAGVATTSSSFSRSITRSSGPTTTSVHNYLGVSGGGNVGMSNNGIGISGLGSNFGLGPVVHSISTSSTLSSLSTPASTAGTSLAYSVSGSSALSASSDVSLSSLPLPTAVSPGTGNMLNPYATSLKPRKNTTASTKTGSSVYTNQTSGTNGTSGTRGTTATGPVEDVLPWELSPPPSATTMGNGADKRKSEDALGFSVNGKYKSDNEEVGGKGEKEKMSKRDMISSKFKSKRPTSMAPLKGSSIPARQASGAYGFDDTFPPSLGGGVNVGMPVNGSTVDKSLLNPPLSPSRRSIPHSDHSGSRSSGDWQGAGGGRHGSVAPRSPPSKKHDLPLLNGPPLLSIGRQLPLTGPVEEVAPWEIEDHGLHPQDPPQTQPQGSQAVKSRLSLTLGEPKSTGINQSLAVHLPSPSFLFTKGSQPSSGVPTSTAGGPGGGGSRSAAAVHGHGKSGSYHHSSGHHNHLNEDASSVASVGEEGKDGKERAEKCGRKRANSVAASLAASLVSVASAISGDSQAVAAASQNYPSHQDSSKGKQRPHTADSALQNGTGQRSLANGVHSGVGSRPGSSATSLALSGEFDKKSLGSRGAWRGGSSEEGEFGDIPDLHDFASPAVGRAKSGSRPSSIGPSLIVERLSSAGSHSGMTPNHSRTSQTSPGAVPIAMSLSTSTGATSIVSSMSVAQIEEVTPWELYAIPPNPPANMQPTRGEPAAVNLAEMGVAAVMKEESSGHHVAQGNTTSGGQTYGKGRRLSRPSTSSSTGKTLADFGLRRRRSTGGKSGNTSAGSAGLAGVAAAAAAGNEPGSGSASNVKGISNVGISYTPADFQAPGLAPPPIAAAASTSSASSAQSRTSKPKGSSIQSSSTLPDADVSKFSTADRTILEELKANIRARESQFATKGVGHTIVGGGKCTGKKYHPYSKKEVPYPRSYDTEVVDLDVWETMFCLDAGKSLTWHVFESPPTKVLEIGCGTGTWVLHCARTWKNCHFVGLDIVPLHPNLQNVGSPDLASRITWVQHNFLEGPLPFQDEEFDFVHIKRIALGVPENKWDDFFEEVRRIMKPGGAFEMIEEDLFFPGKGVDDYDDVMSLKSDDSSRKTSLCSIRDKALAMNIADDTKTTAAAKPESPSTPKTQHTVLSSSRPATPTKPHREANMKNISPISDRSNGPIILPHSRSAARPTLHVKTHDAKSSSQDHKRDGTFTNPPKPVSKSKTTPFLLRTLATTAAPHNPRDHTILAAIWHGMLESRFVNSSPLSLLTAYLEYHFRDVRAHPIQYTFPIPPPPKHEDEDDNQGSGLGSLDTPKPVSKLPALPSFKSMQSISPNGDQFSDQSTPTARHQSSFASFEEPGRGGLPLGRGISTGKMMPNSNLNFEGRTLNLHLSLRAKEIIACSEPMWEYVEELQLSHQQTKGPRFRSGSIETALLGCGASNGRMSADITRNAILEMTRDDFDQILNNFQMDMQDKACVGYALEQRFNWRTFELEPLQDRKAFVEANRKYDQWMTTQRQLQPASSTTHRSRLSLSHPNSGLAPVEESTRPSMEDAVSLTTTLVPSNRSQDLLAPHLASQQSLHPHPSSQLSRALRIFVAWKSHDRQSS